MADCLNCDTALPSTARFCPHCGQRTDTARLAVGDMIRDLLHSFANVERGPLAFALSLLRRPGETAREYVQGRRRRHYGPFATLAVLAGGAAFAVKQASFQVLADEVSRGPEALLSRHFDLIVLLQLPLLGMCCALLFRSERLTWPEHMALGAYTLGVRAVVLSLLIALAAANAVSAPSPWQRAAFWGVWYFYFGWAASQFYRGARARNFVLGTLAAAGAHALTLGALALGGAAWDGLFGAIHEAS